MRYIICIIALLGGVITSPALAGNKIDIFACEPEWASLASEIVGGHAKVFTAINAMQDPHHVRAKPSLIAAMRRADMVVCSGASLENGWLPILQQKAGNSNTQIGGIGYLLAANYVAILQRPVRLDRVDGDIHPQGNPHIHLNPYNISRVAKEMTRRLIIIDPSNRVDYQANYESFLARWKAAIRRWEKEAKELRGVPVVTHHRSFTYLLNWLKMKEAWNLETKPGIPPTTTHLENLLQNLRGSPIHMILRSPYDLSAPAEWLSEKTGDEVVILPFTVGGNDDSKDLFGLFDSTIRLLKEANHD
jgi:zinc/manganese transport system substrate-binding protein